MMLEQDSIQIYISSEAQRKLNALCKAGMHVQIYLFAFDHG
jgi:hypothetical protein